MPVLFVSKIVTLNHNQPVRHRQLAHLPCLRPRSCCSPPDSPAVMHTRTRAAMRPWFPRLTLVLVSSPCAQSRQADGDLPLEDAARRQPLQQARRQHPRADFAMAHAHGCEERVAAVVRLGPISILEQLKTRGAIVVAAGARPSAGAIACGPARSRGDPRSSPANAPSS